MRPQGSRWCLGWIFFTKARKTMAMTDLMHGKKGLIVGVANERSLAWGIAQALHQHGAELAFTYFDKIPKFAERLATMAAEVGSTHVFPMDIADEKSIANVMLDVNKLWGEIDFVVHAVAFADKDELRGRFKDTTQAHFAQSLETSAYSLISLTRQAMPLMKKGGSILTLSYYGAEKVVPNYNVMGVAKAALEANVRYLAADVGKDNIRVNALSAGPVKTLAASGIGDFKAMLNHHEATAPLKRLTSLQDVGGAAVYLLSDLAQGVTGEVHYVDGGANILGPTPLS